MPAESRPHRDRRREIRASAYRCFRDLGYHETSVDAICREAGISKGSLYWHYASKQDVLIDILSTWANQVMEELYEQFERALQEPDYLDAITVALQREVSRGRAIVPLWLEFTVHSRREPEVQAALARFYRRARAAIAEMLRPALGARCSEEELRAVAAATFGAYTGLMVQDLCDPDGAAARRAVEEFMPVLRRWFRALEAEAIPTGRSPLAPRAAGPEVDALFAAAPAPVRARALEIRALVHEAVPAAAERVIPGWKVLGYSDGTLFCTLRAKHDRVVLGFPRGAELTDPGALLSGDGKRARSMEIAPGAAVDREAILALVRAGAGVRP